MSPEGLNRISPLAIRKADGFDAKVCSEQKADAEAKYLKSEGQLYLTPYEVKVNVAKSRTCKQCKPSNTCNNRIASGSTGGSGYIDDRADTNTISTAVEVLVHHIGIDSGKNDGVYVY